MEREDRHAERVIRRELRVWIEIPICEGICSARLQAGATWNLDRRGEF
jgi:hypothetical protein